ncbi:MAG: hypothetical protein ABFC54_10385 [Thermoguttaceae bacterium]
MCQTILLWGCFLGWTASAWAADPVRAAIELRSKFTADIDQLTQWCESKGLKDEAQKTRRVLSPTAPDKLFVPILPTKVGPEPPRAGASSDVLEWDAKLNRLRHDYAAALYDIARRAVRSGRAGLAFDAALAAGYADPDFEPVRRLFGYQKYRNQWHTAYEVQKLRAGNQYSPKFGWIPKSHLHRYEEGQRFEDGRWISAEQSAKRHDDIQHGWTIETEHYVIRTDDGIEAAVRLGEKLEHLHRLWQQLFLRYFASEADVIALFDGKARGPVVRRHQIVYFRDRNDYNQTMKATVPNVEKTLGAYIDRTHCAYFFPDQENHDRTLYHEATHQLFHESRPVSTRIGAHGNFWIIEGAALYMESLHREDGFFVLGGFEDERMHAAQYRLLVDHFYVPLAKFTAMNIQEFQSDPRVATLYSQAAGLANFLVHYDGGRYRDAMVAYLALVYSGQDESDTLARLTGVSYTELDRQYRRFMESGVKKTEGRGAKGEPGP